MQGAGAPLEPPLSPPVIGGPAPSPAAPPAAPADAPAPAAQAPPIRRVLNEEELEKLPIQALLVRAGAITIDQLSEALRENVASGRPVEEVVVAKGWVSAEEMARLVAAKQAVAGPAAAVDPPPAPAPEPPAQPPAAQEPAPPAPQAQAAAPPPTHYVPVPQAPEPAAAPVPPQAEAYTPPPPPPPAAAPPAPAPAPQASVAYPPAAPPAAAMGYEVTTPGPEEQTDGSIGLFLNLTNGARIWVGRFGTQADAEAHAQQIISAFVRPEPGVWPRFGGRFIRPEAVVSVELSRRRDD